MLKFSLSYVRLRIWCEGMDKNFGITMKQIQCIGLWYFMFLNQDRLVRMSILKCLQHHETPGERFSVSVGVGLGISM